MAEIVHPPNATPPPQPKKFLDRLRDELRVRHYARQTEEDVPPQIYTHVMQKPGLGVRSPLDG